jgi:hypothetical protein
MQKLGGEQRQPHARDHRSSSAPFLTTAASLPPLALALDALVVFALPYPRPRSGGRCAAPDGKQRRNEHEQHV